jgi:hypothetical protein
VHVADEVAHGGEHLIARLDHDVDPVAEDVEVPVGDQRGHLDQPVAEEIQTGHLAVDPDEFAAHGRS